MLLTQLADRAWHSNLGCAVNSGCTGCHWQIWTPFDVRKRIDRALPDCVLALTFGLGGSWVSSIGAQRCMLLMACSSRGMQCLVALGLYACKHVLAGEGLVSHVSIVLHVQDVTKLSPHVPTPTAIQKEALAFVQEVARGKDLRFDYQLEAGNF